MLYQTKTTFFLKYFIVLFFILTPILIQIKPSLSYYNFPSLQYLLFATIPNKDKPYKLYSDDKSSIPTEASKSVDDNDFIIDFDVAQTPIQETTDIEEDDLFEKNTEISKIDKEFQQSTRFATPGISTTYGDIAIKVFGKSDAKIGYGYATYLSNTDARDDFSLANSNSVQRGFILEPDVNLTLKGKAGKRILLDIDFDRTQKITDNKIQLKYFALRKREFVQEVTIGNINIDFPNSEFTNFKGLQQKNSKTLGIESKFQKGKFKFHAIATLTRGEFANETFIGKTSSGSKILADFEYVPRKYFQLEPFLYYDGLTAPPNITQQSYTRGNSQALNTFTSTPTTPFTTPNNVQIDPGSIEIWLDNKNTADNTLLNSQRKNITNANGTITIGDFHRLQEGVDFKFNSNIGRIEFIRGFPIEACIFTRYTRLGSSSNTTDPAARINVDGKIETFIYCGNSIQEDTNKDGVQDVEIIPDGKINYDIYEVRGVYNLQANNIQKTSFYINIIDRSLNPVGEISLIGQADIDYNLGTVSFFLREPFKSLKNTNGDFILSDNNINLIYTENPINTIQESKVLLRSTFTQDTQNYRLRNNHIIEKSVRVKVDGIEISQQLYRVDNFSGFFYFLNKDQPIITPATKIEISYEYSPFGQNATGFIVGLRSEYAPTKDITIGNTLLYNGQFQASNAPRVGEESTSKFIIENDLKLDVTETRLTRLVNLIPGVDLDLIPVRYKFYGEYTQSIYNPNTFGLALVDDLEASEESKVISLSEKDWVLGSVPPSLNTDVCSRVPLFYRYYRDLNNLELGPTSLSSNAQAAPNYNVLSGPYNAAEGKLSPEQLSTTQKQNSLVLDFDFATTTTTNPFISLTSRRFAAQPTGDNLTQIDYIEFAAKLIDASSLSEGVAIRFDIGSINEDSDGDSQLDSEDIGLDSINNDLNGDNIPDNGSSFIDGEKNGILDYVSGGADEDVGYTFNSPSCSWSTTVGAGPNIANLSRTRGNGVLNTEDLNLDGFLSKTENVVTIDEQNRSYLLFDTSSGLNPNNIIKNSNWHLVRIYIDLAKLTENQRLALRNARNLRMYIVPVSSFQTQGKGKILIDSLKLGSSKWRQKRIAINGLESDLSNPSVLQTSIINTEDASLEYRNESFIQTRSGEYDALHGTKTNTERSRTKEAALKIKYNLNTDTCSGVCSYAYTQRVFTQPLDLRYYNKLNIWMKRIEMSNPNDEIFVRLGSSDTDYIEIYTRFQNNNWNSVSFSLPTNKSTQNCSNFPNVKGCPNFKDINTIAIGIKKENAINNSSGSFWVNDIYVSDTQLQTDNSYRISNYLQIIKPLHTTKSGIPILDKIELSYDHKYQGSSFFTLQQTSNNVQSRENNLQVSTKILPWWYTNYKYLQLDTVSQPNQQIQTQDLQGSTKDYRHSTEHTFQFSKTYIPVTQLKYTYRNYTNNKDERINDTIATTNRSTNTLEQTHTPYISLKETTPDFWHQKIQWEFNTSSQFFNRDQNINENKQSVSTSLNRTNWEQQDLLETKLVYQLYNFSLQPSYTYSRTLVVKQNFIDNDIFKPINGKFLVPILETPVNYSYRQRKNIYNLKLNYKNLWFISPEFNFIFQYQENSFRDNELSKISNILDYNRYKQPNSVARVEFALVADPKSIWHKVNFIQSINFSFFRDLTLLENSLPFTQQPSVFNDEFGLSSRFTELSKRAFDVFSYPLWYHFISKGRDTNNYANGRTYIQNLDFKPKSPSNLYDTVFNRYSQNIALKENIRTNVQWRIKNWLVLITEGYIGQEARRDGNVGTNPTQRVTWGLTAKQAYDLMNTLNFWFWKKDNANSTLTRKSSTLELNLTYENISEITNNNQYNKYSPETLLSFNWFDLNEAPHSLNFKLTLGFIVQNKKDFITANDIADAALYKALQTLPQSLKRNAIEAKFTVLYSVGLYHLAKVIQRLIKNNVRRYPRYTIELSADFRRFDYDVYSGQNLLPYDTYIINQTLDMNLHKNVTGVVYYKNVFDFRRNFATGLISQRIFAFEFGMSIKILF